MIMRGKDEKDDPVSDTWTTVMMMMMIFLMKRDSGVLQEEDLFIVILRLIARDPGTLINTIARLTGGQGQENEATTIDKLDHRLTYRSIHKFLNF